MTANSLEAALEAHASGDLEKAAVLYKGIINIDRNNAIALANLGNIHLQHGNHQEALELTLQANKISPNDPTFLMNLGGIYKDLGNHSLALKKTKDSLALNPNNPIALTNLASILRETGKPEEALKAIIQSISMNPGISASHLTIAAIYKDMGNTKQAYQALRNCLKIDNTNRAAMRDLCLILRDIGNLEEAEILAIKCYSLDEKDTKILNQLGLIQLEQGKKELAQETIERAINLDDQNPISWQLLGEILIDRFLPDQAMEAAKKSIKLDPNEASTLCTVGRIYNAIGDFKKANKYLLAALNRNPNLAEASYQLSRNLESKENAKSTINHLQKIQAKTLSKVQQSYVNLAFSNCHHKLENYSKSEEYLLKSNSLKYSIKPSECKNLVKEIIQFTSVNEPQQASHNKPDNNIIFIVGMPRSGSTLLENILTTNPNIMTVGESDAIKNALLNCKITPDSNSNYSKIKDFYHQHINEQYNFCGNYNYIVDKQLYNFRYAGVIASQFPNCKIVHMKRHPLDNILSILRAGLRTTYTSSAEDIAKVLIAQENAMIRHKGAWPEKLFTFQYDQFVRLPQPTLSPLLDWLNLNWDDNYLNPQSNNNAVFTASVFQVRKPVSSKSLGGWRKYSKLLENARQILVASDFFSDFDFTL